MTRRTSSAASVMAGRIGPTFGLTTFWECAAMLSGECEAGHNEKQITRQTSRRFLRARPWLSGRAFMIPVRGRGPAAAVVVDAPAGHAGDAASGAVPFIDEGKDFSRSGGFFRSAGIFPAPFRGPKNNRRRCRAGPIWFSSWPVSRSIAPRNPWWLEKRQPGAHESAWVSSPM